jgi:glutathione S-transferase
MTPQEREAQFSRSPIKKRAEYKRDVVEHGLESHLVRDALEYHEKLLHWIDEAVRTGPYLAGESFSLAECATIPYVLRLELLKMSRLWERYPALAKWWERVRARPSFAEAIAGRMTEKDWAPFRGIEPDPWPKVRELLAA